MPKVELVGYGYGSRMILATLGLLQKSPTSHKISLGPHYVSMLQTEWWKEMNYGRIY